MDFSHAGAIIRPKVPATPRNAVGVPVRLPADLPAPAVGTWVPDLPAPSWFDRSLARFHYADDDSVPHSADDYPYSPVWAMWEEPPAGTPGRHGSDYGFTAAGKDFLRAVSLAAERTRTSRDAYGWPDRGAQGVLQGRDGTYYLADLHGWGDEIPIVPGEPGGPQAPYSVDQALQNSNGKIEYRVGPTKVERHTTALKAVVDQFHWVDFSKA